MTSRYQYTDLCHLNTCDINSFVNVHGIIKYVRPITKTNNDFHQLISIFDQSIPVGDRVVVNFFSKTAESLSNCEVGNIIRIHRALVKKRHNTINLTASLRIANLSYVIFGNTGKILNNSNPNPSLTRFTVKKVQQLLAFKSAEGSLYIEHCNDISKSFVTISCMQNNAYFNLRCQVIAAYSGRNPDECTILKVWDGTPRNTIKLDDINLSGTTEIFENAELARRTSSLCVYVCVYGNHAMTSRIIQERDVVELVNLHVYNRNGSAASEICMHNGTSYHRGVSILPKDSPECQQFLIRLPQRVTDMDDSFFDDFNSSNAIDQDLIIAVQAESNVPRNGSMLTAPDSCLITEQDSQDSLQDNQDSLQDNQDSLQDNQDSLQDNQDSLQDNAAITCQPSSSSIMPSVINKASCSMDKILHETAKIKSNVDSIIGRVKPKAVNRQMRKGMAAALTESPTRSQCRSSEIRNCELDGIASSADLTNAPDRRVILVDCDGGTDDAQGILLALRCPELCDINSVTTVYGNAPTAHCAAANVTRILNFMQIRLPVITGCNSALLQTKNEVFDSSLRREGVWNQIEFPEDLSLVREGHASNYIVEAARKYEGKLTIVALGPLTNIAIALNLDDKLEEKIKELVILGGNTAVLGSKLQRIEFNFSADPASVECVFNRLSPVITLVPLELCEDLGQTWEWHESHLANGQGKGAKLIASIERLLVGNLHENCENRYYQYGLVAMMVALDRQTIKKRHKTGAQIESYGPDSRGLLSFSESAETRIEVVTEIDLQHFDRYCKMVLQ